MPPPSSSPPRAPSVSGSVARFVLASLAAIAVVVTGAFFVLRSVAVGEAERGARTQVVLEGRLVEAAGLRDGVRTGAPAALARLDDLVQGRILNDAVVRVKLWSRDGTILYSDEPQLIGRRYGLGAEELELFDRGGADAELSDLSKPENRFERQEGKLLEAHTVIRTPSGDQVLYETYSRFGSVTASAQRLLRAITPPLLGGILVLLLLQVPLAWQLSRRLQRGQAERERLLTGAVDASDRERQRIAADLHDGVVQDLAGLAFGLAPLAEAARRRGEEAEAARIDQAVGRLQQGQRDLRTLLVEIHPPSLEASGLAVALSDLLSPLRSAGTSTQLDVEADGTGDGARDALVYRVAREALRNVAEHAGASEVAVTVDRPQPGAIRLVVEDDGRGFDAHERERRVAEGHVGLTLLEDLVLLGDGTLDVVSSPGAGTRVELGMPSR